ncbi:unnamed protein product [Rangifer tarandus platyrhynchus]|uniref:Uncharacterized protein n=2 Tax=Rangifer tarandus platyrhynchus TaxID=3082113 RepID=A0ACB0DPX7_RANTA|nr:unnamed protein product [Rangifer tarandus platyrhynchus]CAI9690323.1 unnamed protein product [Rangifer tarandus platyrhynchus]
MLTAVSPSSSSFSPVVRGVPPKHRRHREAFGVLDDGLHPSPGSSQCRWMGPVWSEGPDVPALQLSHVHHQGARAAVNNLSQPGSCPQ